MVSTLIMGFLSVLFAYLGKYENIKWGLKGSFILIFSFLSMRYNYGNDYGTYLNDFSVIKDSSILDFYISKNMRIELGWIVLCKLFSPLGFFALVAFLALFNCIVYYRFISKYVPSQYYWVAVFIYIFSPYIMLVQLSAMRQCIAILFFIISIDFIIKRKLILYFLAIIIASFFHTSALVLLPFYFLGLIKWEVTRPIIVILALIHLILILSSNLLRESTAHFITSYFNQYGAYLLNTSARLGLMVPFTFFMLIIILSIIRFQNIELRILFMILIISFLLLPVNIIFPMTGRITFYFQVSALIVYPLALSSLRDPKIRFSFLVIIVIFTCYMFFTFFQSETWQDYYGNYQTILRADKFY